MPKGIKQQKRRCEACNTMIVENNWEQHINGKKHAVNLARTSSSTDVSERSIFVTGFFSHTTQEQIHAYFMQFGPIVHLTWDKDYNKFVLIEFAAKSVAQTVLCQQHTIGGRQIVVKERRVGVKRPAEQGKDDDSLHLDEAATERQLVSEPNVDEQIKFLLERFALSSEEAKKRQQVCQTVEMALSRFFRECRVIPYGSCVNGLGMIDSDLDVFLDLAEAWDPGEPELDESQKLMLDLVISQLENYWKSDDPTFLIKVRHFTKRNMIELLSKIIRKYGRFCRDVIAIKGARCPIVKFYHVQSAVHCDLSIENGLVVYNTKLIKFYQELDPRVYPILFAIRYWTKRKGLLDSQRRRFNSYTVTMLTLFYLQNCKPPVLPTVETLQKLADHTEVCYGWLCHFCTDKSRIPPNQNSDSLERLFAGFFYFYSELSLVDNVLCLRTGQVVSRSKFLNMTKEDSSLSCFEWKSFNIQDPFELDCNIAANFSDQAIAECVETISEACRICKNFWTKRPGALWGLAALLDDSCISTLNTNFVPPVTNPNATANRTQELFDFNVIINAESIKLVGNAYTLTNDDYIKGTALIVRDVFRTALLFECEDIDVSVKAKDGRAEEPQHKKFKSAEDAVTLSMDKDILKFSCVAYHRTWVNRKPARKAVMDETQSLETASILMQEARTSQAIIQDAPSVAQPLLEFICSIRPFKTESQIGVVVCLCVYNVSKEFVAIFSFLKSYVPKITNQKISADVSDWRFKKQLNPPLFQKP